MTSRSDIPPIETTLSDRRQKLARYYGVHPYFTRRSAAVVRAYIERYSRAGDTVADPFGGSGVTAIEALLMGRRAIHNDLNPFANFLTATIADTRLNTVAEILMFSKLSLHARSPRREQARALRLWNVGPQLAEAATPYKSMSGQL